MALLLPCQRSGLEQIGFAQSQLEAAVWLQSDVVNFLQPQRDPGRIGSGSEQKVMFDVAFASVEFIK